VKPPSRRHASARSSWKSAARGPPARALQASELEPDERLGRRKSPHRLAERRRGGGEIVAHVRDGSARARGRRTRPRGSVVARRYASSAAPCLSPELVHASDALPDVARLRIEVARLAERGERGVQVAAPEVQLAARGERVLLADRRRVVVAVEGAGRVERLGGASKSPRSRYPRDRWKRTCTCTPRPRWRCSLGASSQMMRARASASTASRGRWSFSRQ
jgi:hypothetical protein